MRILLTNDDGIHAEGLASLERVARTLSDDVWVVAPEQDQSGYAHSLSISEPLRLRKISEKHFAVRGTPTDCVIMGVRKILPGAPDLILSGINSGANIADDVTYSGTVAGAMEGALLGIRSIALSQGYSYVGEDRVVPYETTEALAPALLKKLVAAPLPDGVLLNVNSPTAFPRRWPALLSPRRASWSTACGSTSAATAVACLITGCASAASRSKASREPISLPCATGWCR